MPQDPVSVTDGVNCAFEVYLIFSGRIRRADSGSGVKCFALAFTIHRIFVNQLTRTLSNQVELLRANQIAQVEIECVQRSLQASALVVSESGHARCSCVNGHLPKSPLTVR